MRRYKIITSPAQPNGRRTRSPLAFHVEYLTLSEAMKHAEIIAEAKGHEQLYSELSIWGIKRQVNSICQRRGLIQWEPLARRNMIDGSWHISKAGVKHENV